MPQRTFSEALSSDHAPRLAITYRPLSDLIPDARNAHTHPKRQIDQIRASIDAFGFTNPILADPDGHIIAGHGRLQAARGMELAEVPVITLSGLSQAQTRALRIADNKIALNAGLDLEILQLELSELASCSNEYNATPMFASCRSTPADAIDRTATIHRGSRAHCFSRGRPRNWPRPQHDAGPYDATRGIANVLAVHDSAGFLGADGYKS